MKITKVEYSKTFNLGNYQSAKIGFEAEVDHHVTNERGDAETYYEVLNRLQSIVESEGAKLKR